MGGDRVQGYVYVSGDVFFFELEGFAHIDEVRIGLLEDLFELHGNRVRGG